jgi:hypothetical protein
LTLALCALDCAPAMLPCGATSRVLRAEEPAPQSEAAPPFYADKSRLLVVLDAQSHEQPVRTVPEWTKRRAQILASMQQVMGPLPGPDRRCPLDVQIVEEVAGEGYLRRKLSFAAEPGDRVPAYLLLPSGEPRRRPAVLCLHQTHPLGKGEPAGLGDNPNKKYALEPQRVYAAHPRRVRAQSG